MYELIKESLQEIGLDCSSVKEETNLFDIGLDSLMTVLLISKLEEKLKKNLPLENFSQEKFSTIKSIESFLALMEVK